MEVIRESKLTRIFVRLDRGFVLAVLEGWSTLLRMADRASEYYISEDWVWSIDRNYYVPICEY